MTSIAGLASEEVQQVPSVAFDKVIIREYFMTLGDNPAVSSGVPITIGWDYEPEETRDMEDYEAGKITVRTRDELRLSQSDRYQIMEKLGYSGKEIFESIRSARIVKDARRETNQLSDTAAMRKRVFEYKQLISKQERMARRLMKQGKKWDHQRKDEAASNFFEKITQMEEQLEEMRLRNNHVDSETEAEEEFSDEEEDFEDGKRMLASFIYDKSIAHAA